MQGGAKVGPILVMHTTKGVTHCKNHWFFYHKIPCDAQCISPPKKKHHSAVWKMKNPKEQAYLVSQNALWVLMLGKHSSKIHYKSCQRFCRNNVIEIHSRVKSMKPLWHANKLTRPWLICLLLYLMLRSLVVVSFSN
jgi:hypothetical protein